MPKSVLYSRSKPQQLQQQASTEGAPAVDSAAPVPPARKRFAALRKLSPSDPRLLWSAIALLAALLAANAAMMIRPGPPKLTQAIIDSAVLKTLETADLPSPAAKAYETILPSVVQVLGFVKSKDGKEDIQNGVGTGDRKSVV